MHGKQLRELRQRTGLSQREAAALVGISQPTLSLLERGDALGDDIAAALLRHELERVEIRRAAAESVTPANARHLEVA
jgi:transcriptional regulator with XRE-family HTH domain